MGSIFGVCFLKCNNFEDFLKFCSNSKIETYATVLEKDAVSEKALRNKVGVLVLGNEANDLPKNIADLCYKKVFIKMNRKAESLNVSCAGSILMHEMKNFKVCC